MLPARGSTSGQLTLAEHQYDALDGAAALVLVTEWKPFRYPDFAVVKKRMKQPVIFDGRNLYDPAELRRWGSSISASADDCKSRSSSDSSANRELDSNRD